MYHCYYLTTLRSVLKILKNLMATAIFLNNHFRRDLNHNNNEDDFFQNFQRLSLELKDQMIKPYNNDQFQETVLNTKGKLTKPTFMF